MIFEIKNDEIYFFNRFIGVRDELKIVVDDFLSMLDSLEKASPCLPEDIVKNIIKLQSRASPDYHLNDRILYFRDLKITNIDIVNRALTISETVSCLIKFEVDITSIEITLKKQFSELYNCPNIDSGTDHYQVFDNIRNYVKDLAYYYPEQMIDIAFETVYGELWGFEITGGIIYEYIHL